MKSRKLVTFIWAIEINLSAEKIDEYIIDHSSKNSKTKCNYLSAEKVLIWRVIIMFCCNFINKNCIF